MSEKLKADLCIIGAGSGGLSVAAGAAQLGRKVVLIEKGKMGGDCLNYGCVPSKALLAAAKRAHVMHDSEAFGVKSKGFEVDFPAVMDHVQSVIEGIAPHDSQERFEGLGVTVLRAQAAFTGPRTLDAGGVKITAKHIIVATGSTPFIPPIPGLQNTPYLTNETLFQNREQPEHLAIIGGGAIGVEMAQAHRRLGSKVTIIEGAEILGRDDRDAVAVVRTALLKEGVEIHEGVSAKEVAKTSAGVVVTLSSGETISASHLLVAVGRRATVADLNLEAAGVAYTDKGIDTTDGLRTTNKRIYAIGDVAGGPQFTHMAGDHASTIVRRVLFKVPAKRNDGLSPHVTYCDPELAAVGLSAAEAEDQGLKVRIAEFEYRENDRARAERREEGFIKVVTKTNGEVLGATIVGLQAGELITPWAMAVAKRRRIVDFTSFIAPYPTLGELSKRVAGAWYSTSLFSDRTRFAVRLLSVFD
ncbi:MAG: FAD-dependent oxidoreductase [Pseudomonadota bacterium]